MSTGKVALAALAGLAAGALVGVLFAPEKGSKTRKKLMNKGEDYADDIRDKVEEFVDSLTEKLRRAKTEADGLVEKGRAGYEQAKRDIKTAASNI